MNADELADEYPEFDIIKMDGHDDDVAGVMFLPGEAGPVMVYDRAKVIKTLMDQGMDYDEAQDFHQFNQTVEGPGYPVFIDIPEKYNPDSRPWQEILANQE